MIESACCYGGADWALRDGLSRVARFDAARPNFDDTVLAALRRPPRILDSLVAHARIIIPAAALAACAMQIVIGVALSAPSAESAAPAPAAAMQRGGLIDINSLMRAIDAQRDVSRLALMQACEPARSPARRSARVSKTQVV